MTVEVVCCHPDDDIDEISTLMRQGASATCRSATSGRIMGMVSIGDVNAFHATHQEAHQFLSEYIYGRV